MHNWFVELSKINVNEHVKKKNGLDYLSWMWAWQELKKRYPLSYATVHETPDGMLVWKDPKGCHVKTSVTIVWEENGELREHTVTEYLPCMNNRNQAVDYDSIDSMGVDKTIQRSLTKCIARLGLGCYLYTDEDLPEEDVKIISLQDRVKALVEAKLSIDGAKEKVVNLCKEAEIAANPEIEKEFITGKNASHIEDADILRNLIKKLSYVK